MADIKVYGADWCSDTQKVLKLLDGKGVAYDYIDIDDDRTAAKWVAEQNNGKEKKPTLDIGGQVLSVPSESQLSEALRAQGMSD